MKRISTKTGSSTANSAAAVAAPVSLLSEFMAMRSHESPAEEDMRHLNPPMNLGTAPDSLLPRMRSPDHPRARPSHMMKMMTSYVPSSSFSSSSSSPTMRQQQQQQQQQRNQDHHHPYPYYYGMHTTASRLQQLSGASNITSKGMAVLPRGEHGDLNQMMTTATSSDHSMGGGGGGEGEGDISSDPDISNDSFLLVDEDDDEDDNDDVLAGMSPLSSRSFGTMSRQYERETLRMQKRIRAARRLRQQQPQQRQGHDEHHPQGEPQQWTLFERTNVRGGGATTSLRPVSNHASTDDDDDENDDFTFIDLKDGDHEDYDNDHDQQSHGGDSEEFFELNL